MKPHGRRNAECPATKRFQLADETAKTYWSVGSFHGPERHRTNRVRSWLVATTPRSVQLAQQTKKIFISRPLGPDYFQYPRSLNAFSLVHQARVVSAGASKWHMLRLPTGMRRLKERRPLLSPQVHRIRGTSKRSSPSQYIDHWCSQLLLMQHDVAVSPFSGLAVVHNFNHLQRTGESYTRAKQVTFRVRCGMEFQAGRCSVSSPSSDLLDHAASSPV